MEEEGPRIVLVEFLKFRYGGCEMGGKGKGLESERWREEEVALVSGCTGS